MTKIDADVLIHAAPEVVFAAVADIPNLPDVSAEVTAIEILSAQSSGVGTRFRETRTVRGKAMLTELEVTEYQAPQRIRMVTDSHGTIWDTLFTVERVGGEVRLSLHMDARAHKILPRLLNPLLKRIFRRGIEKHLATVKRHCEARACDSA